MAYEDGELSDAVCDLFDAHLAVCPEFADEDAAADDEVPEDLVHAVLAARR